MVERPGRPADHRTGRDAARTPAQVPMPGPLPDLVRPMLAVPGELPEDDEEWAYELKWDGVRAVAYVAGGQVRLMSRNDLDVTRSYPEVAGLGEQLGAVQAVLDGELVTFDERGAPHFGRLQQRMHVQDVNVARRLATTVPVVYLVFDVLHLDGRPTVDLPYDERRALLGGLGLTGRSWQTPAAFDGPGADVLSASRENGLEGVVAKRRSARYRPGSRSPDWRKVKHVRMQEVVVVGWRPGKGTRAETLGALVLGVHDDHGTLRPAGSVGTGFTRRALDDLLGRLRLIETPTSPFEERLPAAETRDVHWVAPELVGEVAFTEWTSDGRLRHPSWRGLRPDKGPAAVVRET
ncbi:non-homologous end-joining DNA ligase [Cellulomonas sp. URHB0016]